MPQSAGDLARREHGRSARHYAPSTASTMFRPPAPGGAGPAAGGQVACPPPQPMAVGQAAYAQPAAAPPCYRRLDKYTGTGDYNLYRMQFLHHANLMNWDEATRGSQLSSLLAEKALEVLRHLQPQQMQDFAALDGALSRRFGLVTDTNSYRARLKSLRQKPGQDLSSFATEVEDAVRGAHPEYPEYLLQKEMANTFVEGLADNALVLFLTREKHFALDTALASARLQPAHVQEGRSRQARVNATVAETGREYEPWADENPPDAMVNALVNAVNTMTETVHTLSVQQKELLENGKKEAAREAQRRQEAEREAERRRQDADREAERRRQAAEQEAAKGRKKDGDRRGRDGRDGKDSTQPGADAGKPGWWRNVKCHYCKKFGHIKDKCFLLHGRKKVLQEAAERKQQQNPPKN